MFPFQPSCLRAASRSLSTGPKEMEGSRARFDSRGDCYRWLGSNQRPPDPQSDASVDVVSLFSFMSCLCCVHPKSDLRLPHLLAVISAWKQAAPDIQRQTITETFLHDLGKKSKASISDSVDASRGVKMPQGMEAAMFGHQGQRTVLVRFVRRGGYPCRDLQGVPTAPHDVR